MLLHSILYKVIRSGLWLLRSTSFHLVHSISKKILFVKYSLILSCTRSSRRNVVCFPFTLALVQAVFELLKIILHRSLTQHYKLGFIGHRKTELPSALQPQVPCRMTASFNGEGEQENHRILSEFSPIGLGISWTSGNAGINLRCLSKADTLQRFIICLEAEIRGRTSTTSSLQDDGFF